MPSRLEALFPKKDLDRILAAVQRAELGTSGEIVPYVVTGSDHYTETIWRTAAVAGGAPLLILGLLPLIADTWMTIGITTVTVVSLGLALIGGLAAWFIPALRRGLTPRHMIDMRVAQRAAMAFLSEEVFNTHHRVGILIFVSLLERRVVILGDTGINARIDRTEWNGIVDVVIDGIRSGHHADGVIEAIERCGALLVDRGFAIATDDTNELPDTLRMRES